jgi:hypothetical protein
MKSVRILACLVALQCACASAFWPFARGAKGHPGANVVITRAGGFLQGELIGVKPEGLVLLAESGVVTVAPSEIVSLRIKKKMSSGAAGTIGGLVGMSAAIGVAKLSNIQTDDLEDAIGKGSLVLLAGFAVGAVGGILMADGFAKDEVIVFRNKSDTEREQILTRLKQQARVEDYR